VADSIDRRDFFKGAALGAAGLVVTTETTADAAVVPAPSPVTLPTIADAHDLAYAQAQSTVTTPPRVTTQGRPASDFMVDVLKKIGFEYAAINPGSTFQGLHESLINYGKNTAPELITCLHEEAAVAMAHGYAKAAGKPMLVAVHGTVGLLHSSMALFQAWADRVPVVLIVGHHRNPSGVINRPHSAQDMGLLVRSFVKFDDEATNLERFAEATMRAYKIAMTPPMGPVVLTVAAELQESIVTNEPRIPELVVPAPPQGEAAAVREAARMLVASENPLIQIAKLGRTPKAWDLLIELAETLQSPVDTMG
jgi:thiamine pyrophosphate-dependent acetolactate synthase large subunit-like protein